MAIKPDICELDMALFDVLMCDYFTNKCYDYPTLDTYEIHEIIDFNKDYNIKNNKVDINNIPKALPENAVFGFLDDFHEIIFNNKNPDILTVLHFNDFIDLLESWIPNNLTSETKNSITSDIKSYRLHTSYLKSDNT